MFIRDRDWAGARLTRRLYRVTGLDPDAYARFAHDITRDYCDLGRKSAELQSLVTTSTPTGRLMLLDVDTGVVEAAPEAPEGIPTANWRDRLNAAQTGKWI